MKTNTLRACLKMACRFYSLVVREDTYHSVMPWCVFPRTKRFNISKFKQALSLLIAVVLLSTSIEVYALSPTKCESSRINAKNDIKKGKIHFLIQGGIVSTYVKGQGVFEQKYKLKYFDFGCVVPKNVCIADYNAEVGKYLDQKFGKNWRKEVRKDISGI